ncbi:MAG TPA: DUF2231 domain-containing protein [Planctomycetota bacterium]|jgi:uncharacterized membrane protein|nr:DUF2231 domain-containing protein [Planctomycetota bacterium]
MEMKRVTLTGREEMRAKVTVFGHPLHAILTDLPIGCFALAFIWNIVALLANQQPWYAMTFWALLTGVLLVVPTALVGLLDYTKVLERKHPGRGTATLHLVANVSATIFFLLSLIFRGGPGLLGGPARFGTFILALIGIGILSVGGYLGGRLIYHHGVGVPPDSDTD